MCSSTLLLIEPVARSLSPPVALWQFGCRLKGVTGKKLKGMVLKVKMVAFSAATLKGGPGEAALIRLRSRRGPALALALARGGCSAEEFGPRTRQKCLRPR